ncbi:MAG TPA: DUF2073 domain-containing protein [Thermoplasmata archaeon]|nr:DUF2073 domain-containing protein [Thermoplasmata archaeon]
MEEGVRINLISRERLGSMESDEKVGFILSEVMDGKVLVLEEGLSPVEEAELMQRTMQSIDHDTFIGIEIQGYYNPDDIRRSILRRIFHRRTPPRMTVIGPAAHLRTIYKDGEVIQALILTEKPYIAGERPFETPASQPTEA